MVDQIFNLSVLVHSATLDEAQGPGFMQNKQPVVAVSVGNMTQETEGAQWSKEKGQWCFLEAITVEINSKDEISVAVLCETSFNLLPSNQSIHKVGACVVPVSEVLPRLRVEDRAAEGMVYVTPVIGYDLIEDRKAVGRLYLSFETKTPVSMFGRTDETGISSMALADAQWEGPADWKRGSPNKQRIQK
jgi:hypothetical protein